MIYAFIFISQASEKSHFDIAKKLVDADLSVKSLRNNRGKTALQCVKEPNANWQNLLNP